MRHARGKISKFRRMMILWMTVLSVPLVASADDSEYLLVLAEGGLAVIRLRIDIDGRPQREMCRESLEKLCARTDRDQDGELTEAEYDAEFVSLPFLQPDPIASNATLPRPNFGSSQRLLVQTVSAFLFHHLAPPMTLEFAASQMRRISDRGELLDRPLVDTQLFERLDTDGNQKLTTRELERAALVLGQLDFDDDEMISLAELRMQSSPAGMPAANANRSTRRSDNHLSQLSPWNIDVSLVRRVISLYDGTAKGSAKDFRLNRQEIGFSEDLFLRADVDQDGAWDFDELWRFLERPVATVDLTVHLATETNLPTAEFTSHDNNSAKLLEQQPGRLSFEVQRTRLQWIWPENGLNSLSTVEKIAAEFRVQDRDHNGYLELAEFANGPNQDEQKPRFDAIDADHDGKIFLEEVQQYRRHMTEIQPRMLLLHAENLERTLFGPLDVDGDGRLSRRELAGLAQRLPEWDADGDGKLIEAEIPQQYRLTLTSRESSPTNLPMRNMLQTANSENSPTAPLWFRKMDRNRDGEISSREFLGTLELFEKTDTNADGAIDVLEAAAVK